MYGGLRYVQYPSYRGLFLRRTFPELKEMIDRSAIFFQFGAKWNETKKEWRFPSGAVYEFGYFDQWKHHVRYQGQEYQYIAWDELGTVPEGRWWVWLMSRVRRKDDRMLPIMRATANPGGSGHAWLVKRFIKPCGIDGDTIYQDPQTGLTRRFIPAKLSDNPTLVANDSGYASRLGMLPERLRLQLLDGRWDVAMGLALSELDRDIHLIDPDDDDFQIKPWYKYFAAFDWGFRHPASIGIFAVKPGGRVILVDSLHLWRRTPSQIADRYQEKLWALGREMGENVPLRVPVIWASHDCWNKNKARGENTPSIAETFQKYGMTLNKANQARILGLNNMREYVTVLGPGEVLKEPMFKIRKTPGNLITYEVLEGMTVDEKDPEDVLKRDADDDTGEGGDDPYDMVRYGLASRLLSPQEPEEEIDDQNFDTTFEKHMENLKREWNRPWTR